MNASDFRLCAAMLIVAAGPQAAPAPAAAMQAGESLAAENCVAYREDGQGGYRLINSCDYAIEIAFCPQSKASSSAFTDPEPCARSEYWNREKLNAKGEGRIRAQAGQALDLFACKVPGSIEILPSGMARCSSVAPEPVLPLLLSAALKNPGSILTNSDYPPSQQSKEGTTRFDLIVGPDGKPISCTTTVSSGHPTLDQTACNAFMTRARFNPAKDAGGKPTTGRYKGSVTWKAP